MSLQNNTHRYRLYRGHKYIFHVFSTLIESLATTNFHIKTEVKDILKKIDELENLLSEHAKYEDQRIHCLLNKENDLTQHIEQQHKQHDNDFKNIREKLQNILSTENRKACNEIGHELYLLVRKFFAECLLHFDYEETVLMTAIHNQCSDTEIKNIEFETYSIMTPEQMLGMVQVLFPHLNEDDHLELLNNINASQPEKLKKIWDQVLEIMNTNHFEMEAL